MLSKWRALPAPVRSVVGLVVKAGLTVGAFWLLLGHAFETEGGRVTMASAIRELLTELEVGQFLPWVLGAAAVKAAGIACSMFRWHLLLVGQGIRFNFLHLVGSFLIGRFLGTFLPSTIGLDGYKLYDAARWSDRVVEPAAATAVEKVMGVSGLFLCFLVTLPFGWRVLHDSLGAAAGTVVLMTVAIALGVVLGLFLVLFRPGLVEALLRLVPAFGRARIEGFVQRVSAAAGAYRGKARLLATVTVLSFFVHFCTAAMYWFTARAVGADAAEFWKIAFASSIQIFATVLSPVTIAGEGIREIAQALLLTKHIGAGQAVISAALGFWAAEAMTLVGAVFWWVRRSGYAPRRIEVAAAARPAA